MPCIDGKTRIFGLFGYPVEHTASPKMHNAGFRELGLNAVYLPFPVKPELLQHAVAGLIPLGMKGINVTIPHKQTIIPFLDHISAEAQTIGAVNTLEITDKGTLIGHNTDGQGFIRALKEEADFSVKGNSIFISGCGGAGFAIAVKCVLEGATRIVLVDIDETRSLALAQKLSKLSPSGSVISLSAENKPVLHENLVHVDLAVNATPMGMKETDPLPFPVECLSHNTLVYDLVYNKPQTGLIKASLDYNLRAFSGLSMLLYQGVSAFELWTGKKAPVDVMRSALTNAIYGVKE